MPRIGRVNDRTVPALVNAGGLGGVGPPASLPPLDLNDLTDVLITSPTTGEHLEFDGLQWVNTSALWRPAMVEDTTSGLWYVVVTGDGDAVMTEV